MQVKPKAGGRKYQKPVPNSKLMSRYRGVLFCIRSRYLKSSTFNAGLIYFVRSPSPLRREVGLLKELWDMITVVESSMAAWRTTPWREIHVEDMELECKRFSKDIRGLDKEVREDI